MKTLYKILLNTGIFILFSLLFPQGLVVLDYRVALFAAVVFAFLNAFLKPILIFLSLPITIITFGMFLVIINAGLLCLTDRIVAGFYFTNFWWAVLLAIIISTANTMLTSSITIERYQ